MTATTVRMMPMTLRNETRNFLGCFVKTIDESNDEGGSEEDDGEEGGTDIF